MTLRVASALGLVLAACGGGQAGPATTPGATATAASPTSAAAAPGTAATPTPTATSASTATSAMPATPSTSTSASTPAVLPSGGAPFAGSGTFRGVQFSLSCTQFTTGVSDKDVAMQTSQGFVLLSCHDPQTHVQINVTVAAPAVGDVVPKHTTNGSRIAISVPGGEFISTSDGANTGKISVTAWDVASRHITGSYSMQWPHDSSGQGGSLQGSFDVSNLSSVQ